MIKDKPEPREYQLVWDETDGWQVGSLNNSETYSDIHVIEYSAYELLKAKLDRAETLLRRFHGDDFCYEDGSEDLEQEVLEYFGDARCENCDGVYLLSELDEEKICSSCRDLSEGNV